jgi:hypothetical protein
MAVARYEHESRSHLTTLRIVRKRSLSHNSNAMRSFSLLPMGQRCENRADLAVHGGFHDLETDLHCAWPLSLPAMRRQGPGRVDERVGRGGLSQENYCKQVVELVGVKRGSLGFSDVIILREARAFQKWQQDRG